ncbi:nuclease-related domain-containing protein [Sporosarcina sp. BI001-red]|uniref:nuclease-related domain-containing protein n=1 Tax=Sporosarcina sp. BI001-red TaxID=2282866 RepID=UPI0013147816|nr:nuclease-related domain-containing protein [Sporosarcina sp. BI001-red]
MYETLKQRAVSIKAGFGGEQELDRVLENYEFPMSTYILNDVSLSSSSLFQIDTLILTPEFALICEVKNIAGELSVTENPPQLLRITESGRISGFPSPLAQLTNTCQLFEDWLTAKNINLPVLGCVVLAYPKQRLSIFKTTVPILFPSIIPQHVRSLYTNQPLLSTEELQSLAQSIVKEHRSYAPNPISTTYSIKPKDFLTGVDCPLCNTLGMTKKGQFWVCPSCNHQCTTAHQQAILDWFLLFEGPLTNNECRRFCEIHCSQFTRQALLNMNLTPVRATKNRGYIKQHTQHR